MFERISRTWTCQTESESSLPRARDRAEDGCKNSLRSDLRASNLKNLLRRTPSCCVLLHTVTYSAGTIQFYFRQTPKGALTACYCHTGPSTLMNYEMHAFHTEHMLTCLAAFFSCIIGDGYIVVSYSVTVHGCGTLLCFQLYTDKKKQIFFRCRYVSTRESTGPMNQVMHCFWL